ncbi:MAG: hypothetical protein JWN98_2517 [Abditibacteriota bacterium]|nr:hypothetical protein [Abditibacteriota bacterium]
MALKIGRNKTNDETPVAPAGNDAWDEFGTSHESSRVPQPTADVAPRRTSNARVMWMGIGAFALVGGALTAWQLFGPGAGTDEDTAAPVTMAPSMSAPPTSDAAPVNTPVRVAIPVTRSAPSVVKRVKAGDAGIVTSRAVAPALKPEAPGKPARMVPVRGVPTPVRAPDGIAGSPGRHALRGSVVVARPVPSGRLSPQLQAQLKTLWERGARAKQNGDTAGARRAWQQILKLRPGHPGIQEAIDKL